MVTSSYPKFPGDVTAPFIESIARGVSARGHEVDVILPYHPQLHRGADEPVRFLPYRYAPCDAWCLWGYAQSLESDVRLRWQVYLLAPLVAVALRRAVAGSVCGRRYDVAHVHWVVPNAALLAGLLRTHRVPTVISLHGSDVFVAERLAPARHLARRALGLAGAITACSGDLSRRAIALGAPPQRLRTVPYGVDSAFFSPVVAGSGVRELLGVGPGRRLVLGFGRLVEKKGFAYLIEAAARLRDVQLVIAGEGDLRPALERQARELDIALSLPGALDRERMAAALAGADVVVVPSVVDRSGNVDGLPNSLLEAMAAGKPVVATRVAGIPDVVRDGVNGLLVPEKDATALAAALRRLLDEPDLRATLGASARRTARGSLSWDAAARAFEECYAQATALDAD